ncbi:FecR family protein [Chitinophaga qingshengii]|uniref:FecR domain-containing protein n=1 Tax=Chitinophaga qingshengii TaxID=1569794 RepID=A0ABR7TSJ6_9BACT|nr:FecR domain-containing protein [Chitinophaga qingshengii]MBC9933454.1 FecR domain-containing protein [Chitinophaga qingshengii]
MDTYIYEIIAKQLSFTSTPEEDAILREWREASPENEADFQKAGKIWQDAQPHHLPRQKQFDTAAAWAKVDQVLQQPVVSAKTVRLPVIKLVAAAVLLIALTAGAWWIASRPSLKVQELAANDGKIRTLELADKSVITLRPGARIKYSEGAERVVTLEGEAFFDVATDPRRPFLVKTPNQSVVEVLGTSFSVKTADAHTTVIVASGKVRLGMENDTSSVILTSGQKGTWGNGELSAVNNDDPNFMAWKTGILQFNDQSLVEILPQLTDFYGKVIRIEDGYQATAAQQKATISFQNQSCDEVLHELQLLLGFNYKQEGDTIVIGK